MANDPPFATLNHFTSDLEIPERVRLPEDWYKFRTETPTACQADYRIVPGHDVADGGAFSCRIHFLKDQQDGMAIGCKEAAVSN
jgi:hypothetical protein